MSESHNDGADRFCRQHPLLPVSNFSKENRRTQQQTNLNLEEDHSSPNFTMANCSIPTELLEDFHAPPFQNTPAIRWMHDLPPRFGRRNDLLSLMQGTEDEQQDYIIGLLASSIAMFCFFGLWMIVLAVFKCMGPSEVGILSGKPNTTPQTKPRRMWFLRLLVLFAGLSIIVSSILMSVNGYVIRYTVEYITRIRQKTLIYSSMSNRKQSGQFDP
jgi:hypothetical protein